MSVLRVNQITNFDNNGGPEFSSGMIISNGKSITGDINLSGVCTATSFAGDGSQLSVEGGVSNSKIVGLSYIT